MQEITLEVRIPSALLDYGFTQSEVQQHLTEWLALSLFTEDRISSGKAAQLLGITRSEFLALLRTRGIPYLDFSKQELAEEIETANALQPRLDRPPHPKPFI